MSISIALAIIFTFCHAKNVKRFLVLASFLVFFLLYFFSFSSIYAASYCGGGGNPQPGKGGAAGDPCHLTPGVPSECCLLPDGNSKNNLYCVNSNTGPHCQ